MVGGDEVGYVITEHLKQNILTFLWEFSELQHLRSWEEVCLHPSRVRFFNLIIGLPKADDVFPSLLPTRNEAAC